MSNDSDNIADIDFDEILANYMDEPISTADAYIAQIGTPARNSIKYLDCMSCSGVSDRKSSIPYIDDDDDFGSIASVANSVSELSDQINTVYYCAKSIDQQIADISERVCIMDDMQTTLEKNQRTIMDALARVERILTSRPSDLQ